MGRISTWSQQLGWVFCLYGFGSGCDDKSALEPAAKPAAPTEQPAAPSGQADARAAADASPSREMDAGKPQPQPAARDAATPADSGARPSTTSDAAAMNPGMPQPSVACAPRPLSGAAGVHFHHIHFNTVEPDADLEFYEKYLGAKTVEFCASKAEPTRATLTERGYFLYTKVKAAPDPRLNTYLEHIGWIHSDPNAELARLVGLGVPLYPVGRAQCESAFAGEKACNDYWFYLQAPSGARVEVAKGPGPATMGFGHIHLIMGVDFPFFETVLAGAFMNKAVDMVNHTDVALEETILDSETVVDTRGKPIDHIGYSTLDLDAEKTRILAAGLTLAEDISFKPEYGFRSFFLKSAKGVWIEMVEDSPFTATP
jgi:catechol 2,3-dioxygenase-like lactoylglutathione lyase family enzyme